LRKGNGVANSTSNTTSTTTAATPLTADDAGLLAEHLMHRLSAVEPRVGTIEGALQEMTDLLLEETRLSRIDIEVTQGRGTSATSGAKTDWEERLDATLRFGASDVGMFRMHGATDQLAPWRAMGFGALAAHLGGLVVAHINHGAATVASAGRDHLLASVSHELRTPLTFISGMVSELIGGDDLEDVDRARLLDLISEQSADMEKIVEDLLAGAQVGEDRLQLSIGPVDLATEAIRVAESARIDIASAPHPDRIRCMGDDRRVRQILRNLLTNAERYGGPVITISVFRDLRRAYLAVCDDGPAIPIDQRRYLFEDFARLETDRPNSSSVGIGLAVSRRLASLMGGSLGYEHDGRQSRFILGLPISR
jgi:signal transduction histidine kinase